MKMPQSQTTFQPMALQGGDTERRQPHDKNNAIKEKQSDSTLVISNMRWLQNYKGH